MYIEEAKWNAMIAEAKAGIDRWNARAAEHGLEDTFRFSTQKTDRYDIVLTEHHDRHSQDARAVAREIATGEIRATKVVRKRGRIVGFQTRTPDPKAWRTLGSKPADAVVRQLKLLGFTRW